MTIATIEQLSAENVSAIENLLAYIYGDSHSSLLREQVLSVMSHHLAQREPVAAGALWDESDTLLITYGDSLQREGEAPLHTLDNFAKRWFQQAIGTVHLLPVFPYSSDDGFSVIHYEQIDEKLGDWQDIDQLHAHFDLMMDFVLNHCSRQSLWFNDFILDQLPGRNFFIEVDPDTDLSTCTRPRTSPLLARVNCREGPRYVWATFSHDQIDLNYRNPDVLLEFISIMLFYIRKGARILRLDAVAYLWKEIGTTCIHLPQTHAIVKLLRSILQEIEPNVILLTETNVPHEENVSYFGAGDEAHMVYQFSLPPLLLHAINSGKTRYLQAWAKTLAPPPVGCTFLNFTASHDGIGMRPLEGLVPTDDINELIDDMRDRGGFVSTKKNSDGSESPYELNITWFDACRDADNKHHHARFLLTQTVTMSLQGIPAVYIHSLLATPNDLAGVERTGMTRSINRRKWQLDELEEHLAADDHAAGGLFEEYLRRLELRRQQPAFHPDASQQMLELGEGLFGFHRDAPEQRQRITAIYNFTPGEKQIQADQLGNGHWEDLLSRQPIEASGNGLTVTAYGCFWLVEQST